MDELRHKVIQTVSRALRVPQESITAEMMMGDIPQWDSLNHMAVVSAVEREFNLVFDLDDVVDLEGVSDLIDLVERLQR
ncbi:MAG TPA: acyl carrier protein [Thermoanaerobaculia bacterium]|jgi:acyl carrier protein|nr:acyl carrier protein [Thermoanaerobaculia bacterium]